MLTVLAVVDFESEVVFVVVGCGDAKRGNLLFEIVIPVIFLQNLVHSRLLQYIYMQIRR